MVLGYAIRESVDKGKVGPDYIPPCYISCHETKIAAMKEAKEILENDTDRKNDLYITESVYADQNLCNFDFEAHRRLVWSYRLHGLDGLEKMIEMEEQND